jgi:hypothetical protein
LTCNREATKDLGQSQRVNQNDPGSEANFVTSFERLREESRATRHLDSFHGCLIEATKLWVGALPPTTRLPDLTLIQDRVVRFAKQESEVCFTSASELANVGNLGTLSAFVGAMVRRQMHDHVLQCKNLKLLMTKASQGAPHQS